MSETLKISEPVSKAESLVNNHIAKLAAEQEAANEAAFVESVVGNNINDETRIAEATEYMNHLESIQNRTELPQPINEQVVDNIEQQFDYEPVQEINEIIKMMDECRESKDTLGNRKKIFSLETKFQEAFDKCEAQGFDHDFLEAMLNRVYPPKNIEKNEPAIKDDEVAVLEIKKPESSEPIVQEQVPIADEKPVIESNEPNVTEPSKEQTAPKSSATPAQIDFFNKVLDGGSKPPISLENNPLYQKTDNNQKDYASTEAQINLFNEVLSKNEVGEQDDSFIKKATERAKDLLNKTKQIFGIIKNDVVDTIMPKRMQYESDVEYDKRLKRAAVIKSVGLTAMVAFGGHELIQLMNNNEAIANAASLPISPETVPASVAYNINPGDGWYDAFKQIGVPESEWSEVLSKVGNQLVSSGWAYPNGESFGIAHTGQLPDDVVKLIQSSI